MCNVTWQARAIYDAMIHGDEEALYETELMVEQYERNRRRLEKQTKHEEDDDGTQ